MLPYLWFSDNVEAEIPLPCLEKKNDREIENENLLHIKIIQVTGVYTHFFHIATMYSMSIASHTVLSCSNTTVCRQQLQLSGHPVSGLSGSPSPRFTTASCDIYSHYKARTTSASIQRKFLIWNSYPHMVLGNLRALDTGIQCGVRRAGCMTYFRNSHTWLIVSVTKLYG